MIGKRDLHSSLFALRSSLITMQRYEIFLTLPIVVPDVGASCPGCCDKAFRGESRGDEVNESECIFFEVTR